MALQKFIIERDIPRVGTFEREQLRQATAKSNDVLRQLGPDIQWVERDEAIIRKHAEISGFPATKITGDKEDDRSNDRRSLNFCGYFAAKQHKSQLGGNIPKAARELCGSLVLTQPFAPCHVLEPAAATG